MLDNSYDPRPTSSETEKSEHAPERAPRAWYGPLLTASLAVKNVSLQVREDVFSFGQALGAEIVAGLTSRSAQVLEASRWLYQGFEKTSAATPSFIGESFEKLLLGAVDISRKAGNIADYTLDQLAGDPTIEQHYSAKGLRMAVGLLPIVGNTQGCAQARVKYRQALTIEDLGVREKSLHEARRDCLILVAALSLEIATLGASGKFNTALKAGGTVLSLLNYTKLAREESAKSDWLPQINLDLLSARADTALGFKPIRDAMDILLQLDSKLIFGEESSDPRADLK